jgi:hypothetical protein
MRVSARSIPLVTRYCLIASSASRFRRASCRMCETTMDVCSARFSTRAAPVTRPPTTSMTKRAGDWTLRASGRTPGSEPALCLIDGCGPLIALSRLKPGCSLPSWSTTVAQASSCSRFTVNPSIGYLDGNEGLLHAQTPTTGHTSSAPAVSSCSRTCAESNSERTTAARASAGPWTSFKPPSPIGYLRWNWRARPSCDAARAISGRRPRRTHSCVSF